MASPVLKTIRRDTTEWFRSTNNAATSGEVKMLATIPFSGFYESVHMGALEREGEDFPGADWRKSQKLATPRGPAVSPSTVRWSAIGARSTIGTATRSGR